MRAALRRAFSGESVCYWIVTRCGAGRNGLGELDEERKATMVSNLLVVLFSEQATRPVVNAGTLYQ